MNYQQQQRTLLYFESPASAGLFLESCTLEMRTDHLACIAVNLHPALAVIFV
jgi:hypothetical protein